MMNKDNSFCIKGKELLLEYYIDNKDEIKISKMVFIQKKAKLSLYKFSRVWKDPILSMKLKEPFEGTKLIYMLK